MSSLKHIYLTVKTIEGKFWVIACKVSESVSKIKDRIKDKMGIDSERQILVFKGVQLQDTQKLEDCDVVDGATVHLVTRPGIARMPGGGPVPGGGAGNARMTISIAAAESFKLAAVNRTRFSIRATMPFRKLFDTYCELQALSLDSLCFNFGGKELTQTQTPADVEMPGGAVIDVVESPLINCKVTGMQGDSNVVYFLIPKSTPLKSLIEAYCARQRLDARYTRFTQRGEQMLSEAQSMGELGVKAGKILSLYARSLVVFAEGADAPILFSLGEPVADGVEFLPAGHVRRLVLAPDVGQHDDETPGHGLALDLRGNTYTNLILKHHDRIWHVKMKRTTPMAALKEQFCIIFESLDFFFNGNQLRDSQSPEELGLSDNDVIKLERHGVIVLGQPDSGRKSIHGSVALAIPSIDFIQIDAGDQDQELLSKFSRGLEKSNAASGDSEWQTHELITLSIQDEEMEERAKVKVHKRVQLKWVLAILIQCYDSLYTDPMAKICMLMRRGMEVGEDEEKTGNSFFECTESGSRIRVLASQTLGELGQEGEIRLSLVSKVAPETVSAYFVRIENPIASSVLLPSSSHAFGTEWEEEKARLERERDISLSPVRRTDAAGERALVLAQKRHLLQAQLQEVEAEMEVEAIRARQDRERKRTLMLEHKKALAAQAEQGIDPERLKRTYTALMEELGSRPGVFSLLQQYAPATKDPRVMLLPVRSYNKSRPESPEWSGTVAIRCSIVTPSAAHLVLLREHEEALNELKPEQLSQLSFTFDALMAALQKAAQMMRVERVVLKPDTVLQPGALERERERERQRAFLRERDRELSITWWSKTPHWWKELGQLMELPEELRTLTEEVLHLEVQSSLLEEVPTWVREFTRLETLEISGDDMFGYNALLKEVPSLAELTQLKRLSLMYLECLKDCVFRLGALQSLEELNFEGCKNIRKLPDIILLSRLKTLSVVGCANLRELPCIGHLPLQELKLSSCEQINSVPNNIPLTALKSLTINPWHPQTSGLASGGDEGLGKFIISQGCTQLKKLCVASTEMTKLPPALNQLSQLEHLEVDAPLEDMPNIDKLTKLKTLELYVFKYGNPDSNYWKEHLRYESSSILSWARRKSRAFRRIAESLPYLQQLQSASLRGYGPADEFLGGTVDFPLRREDVLFLGCALRAWPPPLVSVGVEYDGGEYCREDDAFTIKLSTCSDQLGLPAGAGVEWEVDENGYSFESQETRRTSWSNDEVLEFFRVEQRKVLVFASGMHARLGAASVVSGLNEQMLMIVADEVLGRKQFKQASHQTS